jgi:hypothetical protein
VIPGPMVQRHVTFGLWSCRSSFVTSLTYRNGLYGYRSNRGAPRLVNSPGACVQLHRSVKTRMDAEYQKGGNYMPRPNLSENNIIWVD